MVELAIKILSVLAGIYAAFASYPQLNLHLLALLALLGAIAIGIIVGAVVYYILSWLLSTIKRGV